MNASLSYILAASLQELFPATEIQQIVGTSSCFFCDFKFSGEFTPAMLPLLEERMKAWVQKKLPFNEMTMIPSNAAQMVEHHGDKKFAFKLRKLTGEISLIQLDRFFFMLEGETPVATDDVPFFKLVNFWPLKDGIRLFGVGSDSKEKLKEASQALKAIQNPLTILEKYGFVSWVGNHLIWEKRAQTAAALIKKKVLSVMEGFDEVAFPELEEKEMRKFLLEWTSKREHGGIRFGKSRVNDFSKELWDVALSPVDHCWNRGDKNSFLHLIRKFLTIFTFDYEEVSVGKTRLEFRVRDRLGRSWIMSTVERDSRGDLVQLTVCTSIERCIALFADWNSETLLNRLKQLEN